VKDQDSDSKEANGRNKRAPRVVVIARGAVGTVEMYNRGLIYTPYCRYYALSRA
jgi:hypothetical protein